MLMAVFDSKSYFLCEIKLGCQKTSYTNLILMNNDDKKRSHMKFETNELRCMEMSIWRTK